MKNRKQQFGLFALLMVMTGLAVWFASIRAAPAKTFLLSVVGIWLAVASASLLRTYGALVGKPGWRTASLPFWMLLSVFLLLAIPMVLSVLAYIFR